MHQGFYGFLARLGRNVRNRHLRKLSLVATIFCLAALLASGLHAQDSFGTASKQPPDEDRYIYEEVPDIQIQTIENPSVRLSEMWQSKPLIVTLIFTRCAGVCSPFLRSLQTAVAQAGGVGKDYQVLVLSFDPRDSLQDMQRIARGLGPRSREGWTFGVASPPEIRRLASATGFWYQWDTASDQYDHPAVLAAIDRGQVVRLLAGATVPVHSFAEIIAEFRGKFVDSYPLPGKVSFRCFEYDPNSGRYSLDCGFVLMLVPGTLAIIATGCTFLREKR